MESNHKDGPACHNKLIKAFTFRLVYYIQYL